MSKALFFSQYKNENWKRIRTILSPSFSTGKLKQLKPLVNSLLDSLIEKIETNAKYNEIIDFRQYCDSFTFGVITKCAFGLDLDVINDPNNIVFESAKSFFNTGLTFKTLLLFLFPSINKYFPIYFFNEKSQQIIDKAIKKVILERISNNIEAIDLLQLSIDSCVLSTKQQNSNNSYESINQFI